MAFRSPEIPTAAAKEEEEDTQQGNDGIAEDKVVLRRVIGLAPTISFILGIIIGTGIFLTPAGVLRGASGSIGIALIVWVVGACISATGAASLVELTLYYRQSGGIYTYLSLFYGPVAGFIYIAVSLLVFSPCGSAIGSIVVVKFLVTPFVGDCDAVPEYAFKAGATCVFMLAVFINSLSAKWPLKIQVFLTYIKVAAVLLIVIMGGVAVVTRGTEKFAAPFKTTGGDFDWSTLPSAFFSAFYTIGGWSYITNVVEEVKRPPKITTVPSTFFLYGKMGSTIVYVPICILSPNGTLVRGMLISLTCTTTLYVLANLAYFAVLTPEEMMASDAVAALFAVRVFGVTWSFVIWLCVVLSAAGSLNGGTFTRSRSFFAAARSKQFPYIISTIHINRRTPMAAILCPIPLALIYIWCTDVWTIINFTTSFGLIMDILVMLSIPYLRWKQPDRVMSYKVPLWACFIYIIFNVVLLSTTVFTNPGQIASTIVICVISLIGYYIYGLTWKSPRAAGMAKSMNDFLQRLLFSVEQEVATF